MQADPGILRACVNSFGVLLMDPCILGRPSRAITPQALTL